jgi:hypothetical protein
MSFHRILLCFIASLIVSVPVFSADNVAFSQSPPGGLSASQCPMFVMFGFDDNGYADGILWFRNLVKDMKNPDGSAVRATFLLTTLYGSNDPDVLAAWKLLAQDGHEIGNHTLDHPHGSGLSESAWSSEISSANTYITQNLGISAGQIKGFRTPYLEYTPNTMQAVLANGLQYDCSIEFGYNGWQPEVGDPDYPPATSGVWWNSMGSTKTFKKLFWPYTLNNGSPPGNSAVGNPVIAGLWEVPVYTYIRADTSGVVTGFDFNLWTTSTRAYFASTIKKNFDLRLAGNRSPLLISAHTDYYSSANADAESAFPNAHYMDRRGAIEDILTYVRTFPETRIVPISNMIAWMKSPRAISATPVHREKDGAVAIQEFIMTSFSGDRVVFSLPKSSTYILSISTVQGRVLERQTVYRSAGNNVRFTLRRGLSAGTYIVSLGTGSGEILKKLVSKR